MDQGASARKGDLQAFLMREALAKIARSGAGPLGHGAPGPHQCEGAQLVAVAWQLLHLLRFRPPNATDAAVSAAPSCLASALATRIPRSVC